MLSITSVDPFKNNKLVKIVENIKRKEKKIHTKKKNEMKNRSENDNGCDLM